MPLRAESYGLTAEVVSPELLNLLLPSPVSRAWLAAQGACMLLPQRANLPSRICVGSVLWKERESGPDPHCCWSFAVIFVASVLEISFKPSNRGQKSLV